MKTLLILIITVFALLFSGCGLFDSNDTSTIIAIEKLPPRTQDNPVELTQCTYQMVPQGQTFVSFSLHETAEVGYAFYNGTVEIYNAQRNSVHSAIFFPVGNALTTLTLDKGTYTAKLQNSLNTGSYFTLYSEHSGLACSAIRGSQKVNIISGVNAFLALEVDHEAALTATLSRGTVTLLGSNLTVIEAPSTTLHVTSLPKGNYILLVHNPDRLSSTLNVTIR